MAEDNKTNSFLQKMLQYIIVIVLAVVVIGAGIELYEFYYSKTHYIEVGHEIRTHFLEKHCEKIDPNIKTNEGKPIYKCPNGKEYSE